MKFYTQPGKEIHSKYMSLTLLKIVVDDITAIYEPVLLLS